MHYTGQTFRPPREAYSPLLEVTVGCSYNQCTYCAMYKDVSYRRAPKEQILADLRELSRFKDRIDRIFLLNGDPFILDTEDLLEIADWIYEYLPNVETITCYASILDIKGKSVEDLKRLRAAGYNQLYVGIETAHDPTLARIKKGCTQEDEYRELSKLEEANIDWICMVMTGIAGKEDSFAHAEETAALLNKHQPLSVSPLTTSVHEGTELEEEVLRGEYIPLTEGDILLEEIHLLEHLDLKPRALFFGAHSYNTAPIIGRFSEKEEMLEKLRAVYASMTEEQKNARLKRYGY
ncbi:MAG: radical SAM protein [Peptoniphilus sp.]|nr:radical SAM protein [Peptoniphilus sp.]MDD7362621.1 radical SAM protein [Bacillota bacterium]MDY6044980.1 radical SAM protein [Peptoniphilus sp.]